jgi:hypothetical protein
MAKGGGSADDIVKAVLARLGVKPAAAAKGAARKAPVKVAPKASSSVPAKTLSREERRAANSARNKATQEKLIAERAAESPAKKAARREANKAKGVARGNRKADEAYGYRTELKNKKAKAWFEKEVDKISRTIDQSERIAVRGSQGRKDAIRKQINKLDEYAKKEGYELKLSDKKQIIKGVLEDARKAGEWGNKRLRQVVGQTGGKTTKEMVDMGARRARAEEIKTGKIVTGKKPDYMTAQNKAEQKRLTALYEKQQQDKLIKKADSQMGTARGPRKKVDKPFVKTKSEIALERAQAGNARKSVIDPKVAKMSPAERKKFLASENKKWKSLKGVKISGRGMTDKEAKDKLASLGEREIRRSAVRAKKVKPSPEGLRRQFSSKEPRK